MTNGSCKSIRLPIYQQICFRLLMLLVGFFLILLRVILIYALFFIFSIVHIKFSVPLSCTILKCPIAYCRLHTNTVCILMLQYSVFIISILKSKYHVWQLDLRSAYIYYFATNFSLGILTSVSTLNFQELAVVGSFNRFWRDEQFGL